MTEQPDLWSDARADEAALRRHSYARLVEHAARPRPVDPVERALALDVLCAFRLAADLAYGLGHQLVDTCGWVRVGHVRNDPWAVDGWTP